MKAQGAAPTTALTVGLVSLFTVTWALGELLLLHKTRWADGEPGLSVADLEVSFTGANRNMLEAMVRGPMRQYVGSTDDFRSILMWMEHGASEDEYTASVAPIIDHQCAGCHHAGGEASFQRLDSYADVHAVVLADPTPTFSHQLLVTKIHLAGIGLMLGITGYFFSRLQRGRTPPVLIAIAFIGLVADFGAWWLMRLSIDFLWLRVAGHTVMTAAFAWMVVVTLFRTFKPVALPAEASASSS